MTTAHVLAHVTAGVTLRVEVPLEVQHQITSAFLTEVRAEVERAGHRYAPNHREFLLELRERVLVGIEPGRLGRGGVRSFVDKVAYRMWEQWQEGRSRRGLTLASEVTPPAATGEMAAIPRDAC